MLNYPILQCVNCGLSLGTFSPDKESYQCQGCGCVFLSFNGIVDFLGEPGNDTSSRPLADHLSSFACPMTEMHDVANLKYRLQPLYSKVFQHRLETPSLFLDVGCGFGGMLAAAAEQFDVVVGVNTDLAELQNAAAWLKRADIQNVLLVRASAQKLPFAPNQFLAVTCVQVLEHVRDPEQVLFEIKLVLTKGGALYLSLPNRYTLRREPHIGLWGIGYMPRRILTWYVTHRRKTDIYRSVNLLSPKQVSTWLEREFGNSYEFIRSGYHHSMLGRLAGQAWHLPIASQLARNIVGDIEALAWR